MPGKGLWKFRPVIFASLSVCFVFSLVSFFWNRWVFGFELAASVIVLAAAIFRYRALQHDIHSLLLKVSQSLDAADKEALVSFPLPALITAKSGEVLWYNDRFRDSVLDGGDAFGARVHEFAPGLELSSFDTAGTKADISVRGRKYSIYGNRTHKDLYLLYWVDNTELKNTADEYLLSRPAVGIIMIDNYDELMQNAKEGEKSVITGLVEKEIMNWAGNTTGFLRRLDRDRYILVFEERHLRRIIEARFDILDSVRLIVTNDRMPATLSIGVGRGGQSFSELEEMARQALDMALGRGGDQAAVKSRGGFEFYGGTSKAVEKRTKVKTRIIASALSELIDGSDNVLIMGHRSSDLDVVGASASLYKAVLARGRDAKIVLNRRTSLAGALLSQLETQGYQNAFIGLEEALPLVTRRTLLIIVDTHRQSLVEFPELYRAVRTVVVIDHHRKMVDFIDNAVIFYHEPFSSSASELVAELMQYIADQVVSPTEANALLAGITLDTRNFTVRTGVRTFEAAAYLRRKGADTANVRLLFAGSMNNFIKRSALVTSAEIYKDCAICATDEDETGDMRVVAPQAADELLSITGVNASFVLYPIENTCAVSARSMGRVNVQLIMESLGGGGHQTMAGAQLKDVPISEARARLYTAIDKYLEVNKG
ncbi:MAG: DHH family phosphoesterase [Clostridia bacterium]|nr:DHH family phosphoesterase [Clostridia bacterium]